MGILLDFWVSIDKLFVNLVKLMSEKEGKPCRALYLIPKLVKNLGTPIGNNDLLIAAIAIAHNLTLVTHNTNEFNRVEGLPVNSLSVNSKQ